MNKKKKEKRKIVKRLNGGLDSLARLLEEWKEEEEEEGSMEGLWSRLAERREERIAWV